MFILGLTGSIGMGKSTAARILRRLGLAVFDADEYVHQLLRNNVAVINEIKRLFPETVSRSSDGTETINRQQLGARVFEDDDALNRLEALLHPRVQLAEMRFLAACARRGTKIAVLDIPLLYETGGDSRCDAVMVVSAPENIQYARVMRRMGMTDEKFAQIRAHQLPDRDKCALADFVIHTGRDKGSSLRAIKKAVKVVEALPARHWPPRWGRVCL